MKLENFEMERMQSTYENVVKYNLSESGVDPVSLRDLEKMGLELDRLLDTPMLYNQSNGTIELRKRLTRLYPGATIDHIEVTNGSSEANFIVTFKLLEKGDKTIMEMPNYMQLYGLARCFGDAVIPLPLRVDNNWEPDWDEFEKALAQKPKMMYISNPNNPTGAVLTNDAMKRIVEGIESAGVWLLSDEVYQGAELDGNLSPSFWGMSDRVVVVSGLSKAYGIPGVRIGWIVAEPDFIADCWARHDYITIAPGTLSDMIAQTAVDPEVRAKLFARTKQIIGDNTKILQEWVDSFDGVFEYNPPQAGALAFLKYNIDIPSLELTQRLHRNKDVLVVAGTQLGMEGYLRLALGLPGDEFREALGLMREEIETLL